MRIGIVGHGVVGSAVARLIAPHVEHEVVIYDKSIIPYNTPDQRVAINTCDLVFLCVPTPLGADGMSCDLSAVEECAGWITAPLCIRSTVPPGTVDRLSAGTGRQIAFSPEYIGGHPLHPWLKEGSCGFLIVGGSRGVFELTRSLYQSCVDFEVRYYQTTARVAEVCKYMENCFLATKVAFVNQFYDIACAFGVDFSELREMWLADPRIGPSHTMVTEERGFRGECLTKDVSALIAAMRPLGRAPLLESVLSYNSQVCETADRARSLGSKKGFREDRLVV